MTPAKLRDLAVVGALALAAAAGFASGPAAEWLRGPSLDLLVPLRHALTVQPAPAGRVAVVAIDEETYRRPPFSEMPQAGWSPLLAPLLNAVAAEAAVIGFDVVYSTSLDSLQRGYEREYLIALRNAARAGKLVLGKVQHSAHPILPHPSQQIAVGGAANIRPLNAFEDPDGVIRRLPLSFAGAEAGSREPGLAAELARRAGAREMPPVDADGNLLLDFNTAPGAVPTYSLADLHACAAAGRSEFFREHFADRVVILASVLDVEDRRLTSRRFVPMTDGTAAPPRCVHPAMQLSAAPRDSIAGVYIHATAVNNILEGRPLRDWSTASAVITAVALSLLTAAVVFYLPLRIGLAGTAIGILLLPFTATLLLQGGGVMPWLSLAAAMAATAAFTVAWRFAVSDRDRRLIAKLFSLYLPPVIVERMVAEGHMPELGGEEREVTVLFSDIAGFTAISEACDPATLVQGLNTYFSTMTDIIEAHGGFVDKYIGDAIVAVFGAPVDEPRHAEQAMRAAMQMRDALLAEPERYSLAGLPLKTRIGLNTGRVLIGNIGSPRRFNYTAMGDAVNLASRLEGANKAYGTSILVSEDTMRAAGDAVVARRVDIVRVVGRAQPVRLYEPLAPRESASAEDLRLAAMPEDPAQTVRDLKEK